MSPHTCSCQSPPVAVRCACQRECDPSRGHCSEAAAGPCGVLPRRLGPDGHGDVESLSKDTGGRRDWPM